MIYEGLEKVKNDIKEDEDPKPVLSYSLSKAINEKQLRQSGKNFVILRLGSVYGYSTDTARIDIMPNLFSKNRVSRRYSKTFFWWQTSKKFSPVNRCCKVF